MTRGADLVVGALAGAGVRRLFSLSGNQILSVYDATIGRDITLVHTRHEAAAVHMADGWARTTEEPGVALVTAGPGHLNAVSALYTALMSQSPVVLLSGHAPRAQAGRGAFQEIDQATAARPVVKAAWVAQAADTLGHDVARALALARAWPPGPVHLSLPGDLLEARVDTVARCGAAAARWRDAKTGGRAPVQDDPAVSGGAATQSGPAASGPAATGGPATAGGPAALADAALERALDLIASAERPLIVAGPAMGRSRRWADVERLSEASRVPALLMESPRGPNDPSLRAAAACLGQADLVLLLGKRLDFTLRFGQSPPWAASCRFVQSDLGAMTVGRVALGLDGDPSTLTPRLAALAARRRWPGRDWAAEVEAARDAWPPAWEAISRSASSPMHPLRVCAALEPHLARGGVLVGDGGEFGQWCQAGLRATHRLINGPSGSIGSAVPMALGARLARPDLPVFAVLGDGTFGFHAMEFDTAVRHGITIVAVVGNDARWNAEHQLQRQQYGAARAVGCELLPTRYDRLVEALGGHGERVEEAAGLAPALERALRSGRPACVDVLIDGVAAPMF